MWWRQPHYFSACVRVIAAARLAAIYFILLQNGHLSFSLAAALRAVVCGKKSYWGANAAGQSWDRKGSRREQRGPRRASRRSLGAHRKRVTLAAGRTFVCNMWFISNISPYCTWAPLTSRTMKECSDVIQISHTKTLFHHIRKRFFHCQPFPWLWNFLTHIFYIEVDNRGKSSDLIKLTWKILMLKYRKLFKGSWTGKITKRTILFLLVERLTDHLFCSTLFLSIFIQGAVSLAL